MLPGRVTLLVEQFEEVQHGTPLYSINSPTWRDIQQAIAEANASVAKSRTTLDTFPALFAAHERHEKSLEQSADIWRTRVTKLTSLRDAGGGRMGELTTAQAQLAAAEAELAHAQEKDAELEAAEAQTKGALAAAEAQFDFTVDTAASLLGTSREELLAPVANSNDNTPLWRSIDVIQVVAQSPGVVSEIDLTNGAWADERTNVLTVVQPNRLRFHATGLQSDLGILRDGLHATIAPPTITATGTAIPYDRTMHGTISLGLTGDATDRTVDLYVVPDDLADWARPGVSAQLEIVVDDTSTAELAIPLAAVQRDGLTPVLFRRDPKDPNVAIRIDADLGIDDGRWVAVLSGLQDGDQVVLDGGYQLVLSTSNTTQEGGHFHADGTFHKGDH